MGLVLKYLRDNRFRPSDVAAFEYKLFFEGGRRRQYKVRFYSLTLLATVIASYGIVNASPATVIGAMIIAPLMTPIMATAAALVMGDTQRDIRALMLVATFVIWLSAAHGIWSATLGPEPPASIGAFVGDVFGTPAGWTMIAVGMAVGGMFAVAVLGVSLVSFPLLLDRKVGLPVAVVTSFRVVTENPRVSAIWGAIVAGSLAVGSIPAFLGLIVVLPVLGHATWHLYRRAVAPAV